MGTSALVNQVNLIAELDMLVCTCIPFKQSQGNLMLLVSSAVMC